jgi:hypothetical protein
VQRLAEGWSCRALGERESQAQVGIAGGWSGSWDAATVSAAPDPSAAAAFSFRLRIFAAVA